MPDDIAKEPELVLGVKHFARLPGNGPWSVRVFRGMLLAASPVEGVYIVYEDGKLEKLMPSVPGETTVQPVPIWNPDPHFGIDQCGYCGGVHGAGVMCPKLTPIA